MARNKNKNLENFSKPIQQGSWVRDNLLPKKDGSKEDSQAVSSHDAANLDNEEHNTEVTHG